jgi:hypothetical protein
MLPNPHVFSITLWDISYCMRELGRKYGLNSILEGRGREIPCRKQHPFPHGDEVSPQPVIRGDTSIYTNLRMFAFCHKFLFLNPLKMGQFHNAIIWSTIHPTIWYSHRSKAMRGGKDFLPEQSDDPFCWFCSFSLAPHGSGGSTAASAK